MIAVPQLLPPYRGAAETAIAGAVHGRVHADKDLPAVWSPEACPAHVLAHLAWALSVDDWDEGWDEPRKRAAIAAAIELHRIKGTRASVVLALDVAGFGDAEIIETRPQRHDGSIPHDGAVEHAEPGHWADFRVRLARPVTVAQAARARAVIAGAAPARARLAVFDYPEALHLHDGAIRHDATYTHGEA